MISLLISNPYGMIYYNATAYSTTLVPWLVRVADQALVEINIRYISPEVHRNSRNFTGNSLEFRQSIELELNK